MSFNLNQYEIEVKEIHRNSSVPVLYEIGMRCEKGTAMSNTGALLVYSGEKPEEVQKISGWFAIQIPKIILTGEK